MNGPARLLVALLAAALGGLLLWVLATALAARPEPALAGAAFAALPLTGVGNPVTAVLLDYRAYDTLLELAVLLAALLGIWSLGPPAPAYQRAGSALRAMVAWVVPLLILTGGYLLWAGGQVPGGAFQGGALLGAAGVVLRLAGDPRAGLPGESLQRLLAVLGVGAFLLVGLTLLAFGRDLLDYPTDWSKWLILAIEGAATLAIGATLAAAYVGGRPPGEGR
ncbi:MnhB domain-containing protein [Marichromatium gracile]|uniref:MnhB domain-containing protein n=1 Tax=Marichromatium gracile TaxID=1048 RepID=UPI001F23C639|nr:MnhB domain-containing protein [Marichromatium gracile]MCF1183176.1 MnhB domain-containing protein [Marichromatium gracile]